MHEDVRPLAFLLGTWRGEGRGDYPSTKPFTYSEEISFRTWGKPYLAYEQRTWAPDGSPMHAELGYWRPKPGGVLEVVMSQPTGHAEVEEGRFSDGLIETATTAVTAASSAKDVLRLERRIQVHGDVLRYEVRMAAVGHPLGFHLAAELKRV